MKDGPASIALVSAGLLFVVFMLVKLLRPPVALEEARQARRTIAAAKKRARDRALPAAERAAALREAALAALDGLSRPGLAASYARRAERLDPEDALAIGLRADALRRASRYRALERMLWRRLAADVPESPALTRAHDELLALYEGPLRRPEIAQALRKLRGPT